MNLAITIARWIADHRAHHAALFLTKCRKRRERREHEMALEVARLMRRDMGMGEHPGLAR